MRIFVSEGGVGLMSSGITMRGGVCCFLFSLKRIGSGGNTILETCLLSGLNLEN